MHIAFDTSALISCFNCAGKISKLVDIATRRQDCIVVPLDVLHELFTDSDGPRIRVAARGLLTLSSSIRQNLVFARKPKDIWKDERCSGLAVNPWVTEDEHRWWIGWISKFSDASDLDCCAIATPVRDSVKDFRGRQKRLRTDTIAKKGGWPRMSQEEFSEYLKALPVESLLKIHSKDMVCEENAEGPTEVSRWLAQIVWVLLKHLADLACAVPDQFRTIPEFCDMLPNRRNDYYDAGIACIAAYCDKFVTDDDGLRQRCEFLRSAGHASFSTVTLTDYLNHAEHY